LPDISERVQALANGSVHIIQSVPPHIVPQLIGHPNVMIKTAVGTRPKLLDLNVTVPPFDDVRVRRALNYAVDANALLVDVAGGYGVVLAGPFSPANLYSDPDLEPYGYDPERAKLLLAEAGHKPEDVAFVIDAYGPYVEIAEAVSGQLRALGMDVTVRAGDYAELVPQLLNCERQAFLRDWGDSAFDPVGYVEAKWHTRGESASAGRGNYACYSNPDVDALIQVGASESDEQVRREAYSRMQRIVQEDAPAVFLYVPQEIEAASDKVRNWEPSPDSRINLHDVWLADS
jgi:peptide/nickel transport system substrate-binding protein